MEHIKTLVEKTQQNHITTHSSKLPKKQMPEKWVAAIFSKFQVRYGHKWTSALPSPELTRLAVSEWSSELKGVTGEQVKAGLEEWDENWPPSAPEFRKLCLSEQDMTHKSGAYKTFLRIDKPVVDRKKAMAALTKARKALGMPKRKIKGN